MIAWFMYERHSNLRLFHFYRSPWKSEIRAFVSDCWKCLVWGIQMHCSLAHYGTYWNAMAFNVGSTRWCLSNVCFNIYQTFAKLRCEVAASSDSLYSTQVFRRHYLQLGSCKCLTCQPWTWIRVVIDGYVRATGRDVHGDLPASFITWACWPCDEGRQGLPDGSGESDGWNPPSSSRVSRDGW